VTTRRERSESVVVEGRVIADFGREFLVEFADRRQVVCTRKGKRQDATCGWARSRAWWNAGSR